MISSPDVKTEIKGLVKDIRCQLKQFKNVYNHVDGRRFVLDDCVRSSDSSSEEPDVSD